MSDYQGKQEILNSVFDKSNIQLKGTSKSGNKQFLKYYIDNDKLSDLLPAQIILNSVFDRQTASLCINNADTDESIKNVLSNYSGDIHITDSDENHILSVSSQNVNLGYNTATLTIDASDIIFNGSGVNTPDGLVTLNSQGYIDNDYLDLAFDPQKLNHLENIESISAGSIQFTVKVAEGVYKYVTLEQLMDACSPKLIIMD